MWLEDGKLAYRNGERAPRVLIPLGGDLFVFADDPQVQVRFDSEGARVVAMEILPAGDPSQGRYERTS